MTTEESLGAIERSIKLLTDFTDHMVHNRPGVVRPSRTPWGASWAAITREGDRVSTSEGWVGTFDSDGDFIPRVSSDARYQPAGIYPEVAAYLYKEALEIYRADNLFFARMASYAITHPQSFSDDLKVIFAALLLVQGRFGAPIKDASEVIFYDDDYRAVGEAMMLVARGLNPKLIKRVGDLLRLSQIAAINHAAGFGGSDRSPATGRYDRAVTRWLLYRDRNPALLKSAINAGWSRTIRDLARRARYKPQSAAFFEALSWSQTQKDGHRTVGLGARSAKAPSWGDLSEQDAITRIRAEKPAWKRIVGLYPRAATPNVIQAALEVGAISAKDLILMLPMLEDLGLVAREPFASRIAQALSAATDLRAANVARNVRSQDLKNQMQDAVDNVMATALEEATRNLRVYVIVDKSGSMEGALTRATVYLERLLVGFPLERLHVSIFNTHGSKIHLRASSATAIEHAFQGHSAAGGTSYRAGVAVFTPTGNADEDNLFLFVGDEDGEPSHILAEALAPFHPIAIGILPVNRMRGCTVQAAALEMGIPCLHLDEGMFQGDPYAVPRILRSLIESTPRMKTLMQTLAQKILETPLLEMPAWAI
jgi:hypothetical protein